MTTKLLTKLLVAWAETQHARVGDAAEALTAKLLDDEPREALAGSKKKADLAAWKKLERERDPLDFPRLMAASRGGQQEDVLRQVRALAKWKHPGFASGVLALLEKPPYAGVKSQALLRAIIELLGATHDRRAIAPVEGLSARYLGIVDSSTGAFVIKRLAIALEVLSSRPEPELDEEFTRLCAQAEALAPPRERTERPRLAPAALDALYELVVANPTNDGPRRVYADALIEAGDARGDFIRAQLDSHEHHAGNELLKSATVAAWLQPLKLVGEVQTARGFADSLRLYRATKRLEPDAPAWRTLRQLSHLAQHPAVVAQLDHPHLANLREVHGLNGAMLDALGSKPRAWTKLSLDLTDRAQPAATTLAPFPALEDLDLHAFDEDSNVATISLPSGFFVPTPRVRSLCLTVADMAPDTLAPLTQLCDLELNGNARDLALPASLERLELNGDFPGIKLEGCPRLIQLSSHSGNLAHAPSVPSLRRAWLLLREEHSRALEGLGGLRHLDLHSESTLAPGMFARLERLLSLELGYPHGLGAEHLTGLSSLVRLGGVWNDLSEFPPLPSLLSFHCMTPPEVKSLGSLLENAPQLEYLDLTWNSSSDLYFALYGGKPEGFKEHAWQWLARALKSSRVRVLDFFDGTKLIRDGQRWTAQVNSERTPQQAELIANAVRAVFDAA